MPGPVVIVGRRVAAAVTSAQRAALDVIAIVPEGAPPAGDGVRVETAPAESFPQSALPILRRMPTEVSVLPLPPLTGSVDVLRAMAYERPLRGSSPDAIASANDPHALRTLPHSKTIRLPDVRTRASLRFRVQRLVFGAWTRRKYLHKPVGGSGGEGIAWWSPGGRLDDAHYLQEYVRGVSMSAIFRGDGWSSVMLGVVEQLVGEPWCGAGPWQPCGAIGPVQLSEATRAELGQIGAAVTQKHDLRGLFAIDLIQDARGRLWPIAIHPHYTDDVAVLERAMEFAAFSGAGPVIRKGRSRPAAGPAVAGAARVHEEMVTAVGATRDAVEAALRQAATATGDRDMPQA